MRNKSIATGAVFSKLPTALAFLALAVLAPLWAEADSNVEASKPSRITHNFEERLNQGQETRVVVEDILNQATEFHERGEYRRALSLQRSALAIAEKFLGSEHQDTATALNNLASTYNQLAQHDQALTLLRRALTIYEKVLGPEHPDTAIALDNLASTQHALALYEQALPLLRRSLAIREKVLGPEHPQTAVSLNNLASTYNTLAQHDQALPLQRRALTILEKALGSEHPDTAVALNNLGSTYNDLAQHDQALPLQRRSLAIREKVFGPEHPDTAVALINLAWSYSELAQYEQALPIQTRALNILEKALGPEHPTTAAALNNLGSIHIALAQHEQALPIQTRALAIKEKVLGPVHPDIAFSLDNLARIHSELGQYDLALQLEIRALDIRETAFGPEHPSIAFSLINLASTYSNLAQYDLALPHERRALAIYENAFGPEHPDTARALNSLASTHSELGQHDKALLLQTRALAIDEKVLGLEHPDTAAALNNLAWTYSVLAQYEQALPLQMRALIVFEKVLGAEHPETALALLHLASTHSAVAQYDQALLLQRRALAIFEKVLGPEHPDTATALNNLASTHSSLAQHEQALPLKRRALAISEKVLGPEHPATASTLSGLAYLNQATGQHDAAVSLYKTAVNAYQAQRERVSRIDGDALRSYTESIADTYQSLADLLVEQGRLAEAQQVLDMLKEDEVFEFIRRSGNADTRRTRIPYTPTEASWAARYREVAGRLASLGAEERQLQQKAKQGLSPKEKARLDTLKADLEVAEKAFMAFLSDMQQSLSAQGPSKVDEVAATSVDAQRELQKLIGDLGPNVVLLQYYVTNDKVGMLLTTPNVVIPFSSEIDAKKLNRDVFDFRRALRDPKTDVLPASQALYKLLLAPVADALDQAGAKTVMLSLDGNLRHLPFGALHDGKQFVAQRWTMPVYTAVTRDKLREGSSTQWRAAGLGVTRAIGEFKALPAVKVEMDGLLRASGGRASQSVVYLDDQFTAAKLKEVGQRDFQLMHISSHFSISPGTEVNSFLLLGDGQRLTLGDIRTQNYRFDNVDLLTLSACDTGLGGGRDANGREIEGLGVIAQQQGAKGVLATLWPVADGSTARLMADMYQRRQSRGLSKIEALRQAQLALMSEPRYSHPFYWAPFILLGNWQ